MRLLLSLLWPMMALATTAQAQRLAYEDVLGGEALPRPLLHYEPVLDQPPRAAARGAEGQAARVRAFYGDRLEWRPRASGDFFNWDMSAEIGSARQRMWLAMTGDAVMGSGLEYLEVHALYSRVLGGSDLALQLGVRRDFVPSPQRSYAVAGVQGSLVGPLYAGGFGYLSNQGEFTARIFASADLSLADRLILQPAIETEIAGADVPELGIGRGPVYVEAGLRLRYEMREAFAPYVGVNSVGLLGRTARIAREAGDEVRTTDLIFGIRSYF